MSRTMSNIGKIFINSASGKPLEGKVEEAYSQQYRYLRRVWEEESYGLERIVRLALCLAQFLFPILLIRDIFGKRGALARRLAVEFYTVFKFLFPLAVLGVGWYRYPFVVFLIIYFLSETFLHILHLIFLSDIHSAAVSYRRSLILIFLHYSEVVFDFAVLYMAFDLLSRPMDPVAAVYFSLVATTTVGFGDIYASNSSGQMLVMAQLTVCVAFIVVFINYFSQRINEK
jgi:hypothetical protein